MQQPCNSSWQKQRLLRLLLHWRWSHSHSRWWLIRTTVCHLLLLQPKKEKSKTRLVQTNVKDCSWWLNKINKWLCPECKNVFVKCRSQIIYRWCKMHTKLILNHHEATLISCSSESWGAWPWGPSSSWRVPGSDAPSPLATRPTVHQVIQYTQY